jgi:tRNA-splicing ligase RtcB
VKPACAAREIVPQGGGLPIRCFTEGELLPDEGARSQLEELARVPGLDRYVAVLPDVHRKARNPSPTGTVVVSRDVLVPRAVDEGVNCGMRMISTGVPAREFTPERLDELFGRLRRTMPVKYHAEPVVDPETLASVLTHGLEKLIDPLDLPSDELTRTENGGRVLRHLEPEAIRERLTPERLAKAIRKGGGTLGTIGAGNHFLELQEIAEVLDPDAADRLGLEAGGAVFMLHTDARRLGKKLLEPVFEEAQRAARAQGHPGELWTVPADSELGERCLAALAATCHAGFANRAAVTQLVRRSLRAVLGDPSLALPLVYDCGHETILRERHDGEWLWVHRHGASRAVPPARLDHDPLLDALGQPLPLPGAMGTDSYLAVARPGTAGTFHSVAHGAGRVLDKGEAAATYAEEQVEDEMRSRGVRLYRYGADAIGGQAPASFKNVHRVIEVMAALDMIRPVLRLRPIAVLKG